MSIGEWLSCSGRWPAAIARAAGVRRAVWALLLVAATTAIYASVSLPQEVHLKVNEIAPRTIYSPRTIVNIPATDRVRQAAANSVQPVFITDGSITSTAMHAFLAAAAEIAQVRQELAAPASPPGRAVPSAASSSASSAASSSVDSTAVRLALAVSTLRENLGLTTLLPAADYQAVLLTDAGTLQTAEQQAGQDLNSMLSAGVLRQDIARDRQRLAAQIRQMHAPASVTALLAALAAQELVPNREQDPAATAAAKKLQANAVQPIKIARGQVIVTAGNPVTANQIINLQTAGLLRPGGAFGLVAGALVLAVLLAALCWAYLTQFHPRPLRDEVQLVLFGAVLVLTLGASRFGMVISPFLAPVAWAAMLGSAAFGPGVALFIAGVGALSVGVLNGSLAVAVSACAGAWTAVFTLRRLVQRTDFIRAGVYSAVVGAAVTALVVGPLLGQNLSLGASLLPQTSLSGSLLREVIASAATGLLSAVLAIGTLPLAEALGVLTPFRLLELADARQPLLHRLSVEAPGTYHHSIMVANLGEAACQAVGGDALLVRAAAYYHDIGKLKRPAFFVENQMGGENPHDKLSPQLSAMVITSHVRDGVEMAHRARLPEELVTFIRTHHGTTLVRYFYHAARAAADRAATGGSHAAPAVSEQDFRYEGPLPETREAAILMLADSIEAAVRSLKQPTVEQIEEMIRKIVADRLQDGQLDAAALTLRDVNAISITFRRILVGAYHARIEYPEQLAEQVVGSTASSLLHLPLPQDPGAAGPDL